MSLENSAHKDSAMNFQFFANYPTYGVLLILLASTSYAQNPPPIGPIVLSEIFLNPSGDDDRKQWVELFNRSDQPIDLSGYSLGNGGKDFTYSLVSLTGTIKPHSFYVIGGTISDNSNGNPEYNKSKDFNPDFKHNTFSPDGVALFDLPASSVTPDTRPVDVVIYGNIGNVNELINNQGEVGSIDIRNAGPDSSLERTSADPNKWRIQDTLNPGTTLADGIEITITADSLMRIGPGEVLDVIVCAEILSIGTLTLAIESLPPFAKNWDNRTKTCRQLPGVVKDTLRLSPGINDGGKYSIAIRATFDNPFQVIQGSRILQLEVVPNILAEPPFSPNLLNELCWLPISAYDQELQFFPRNLKSLKMASSALASVNLDTVCQTIQNLTENISYGYFVQATLIEENKFVELTSDTVFTIQDNSPPAPVRIDSLWINAEGHVTLAWSKSVRDDISFIELYRVFRKESGEDGFQQIFEVTPLVVTDIVPVNYFASPLAVGDIFYLDRSVKILSIPPELEGLTWIRTSSKDKWNMSDEFLSFTASDSVRVYLAYDSGARTLPEWLREFSNEQKTIRFSDLPREFDLYFKVFPPGRITLGGNHGPGADFEDRVPNMYAVLVGSIPKEIENHIDGFYTYVDTLDESSNGRSLVYKVTAVDAVGNIGEGSESPPITIDYTPPCIPEITEWFVFIDSASGEKYGKELVNTVCIREPSLDPDCQGLFSTDSLQYEAVRDSLKFFDQRRPEDVGVRYFNSGWLPLDSLCHIFGLLPADQDPNFVNGHEYFYRVRAQDSNGNVSDWSKIESSVQDVFPPSDIKNLIGETKFFANGEDGCIELNWNPAHDPISGVASYIIYRSDDGGTTFSAIDTISWQQTTFSDTLSKIGENRIVHYKIGVSDRVGNVRSFGDTGFEESIRALVGPVINADTTQTVMCNTGTLGITSDNLTVQWPDFNNTDVAGYAVEILRPDAAKILKVINDPDAKSIDCPLEGGDGLYTIRVQAFYANGDTTIYSNTISIRKKVRLQGVQNLHAIQDSHPTGDIILTWSHPDSTEIIEFQIFKWIEGQERPENPTVVIPGESLKWIDSFAEDSLVAYQCNNYLVKALDCFGLISELDTIVTQYSNRPPAFDKTKTEINDNNIMVCWDRPFPRIKEEDSFDAIVVVYQDSITAEPFDSASVFNQTCFTLFNAPPVHSYIFKVKEIVLDNLNQSCANTFESNWSNHLTVPLDNLPLPVAFEVQALPVPRDSSKGQIFVSWQGYSNNAVNKFLVKWSTVEPVAISDSMQVSDSDTFLVQGLNIAKTYEVAVFAIDTLDQRSLMDEPKKVAFNPRWVFTPKIQSFETRCFRDSVTINWDWVDENMMPADTSFGADSIIVELSIDPNFSFKKSSTQLGFRKSYTFKRDADYPFINSQNNMLFARIRAKDRWNHLSPWSTGYSELGALSGNYDEIPPAVVECFVDSVRAPLFGQAGEVNVHLRWNDVGDNCSGTWFYEITRNDSVIARDTSRVSVPKLVDQGVKTDDDFLLTKWQVHAVDSLGNRQEIATACSVPFLINPPDSGGCVNDTTFCWSASKTNPSDLKVSYFVEGARFADLFGNSFTNILAGPLDTLCINFNVPWQGIFWRIKAQVDNLESAWSDTFFCELDIEQSPTSVAANGSELLPKEFALRQNYPNPFNPSTTIRYAVPISQEGAVPVLIEIFNIAGQKISTLVDEEKPPSEYSVIWNGRDDFGNSVGSGLYIYRMRAKNFVSSHKMIFLK
ncbi:MAG: lamin tail domain-containing protein [bacterium]